MAFLLKLALVVFSTGFICKHIGAVPGILFLIICLGLIATH